MVLFKGLQAHYISEMYNPLRVRHLKFIIKEKAGVGLWEQQLVFDKTILMDWQTLEECNLEHKSSVQLVVVELETI